MVFSSVWGKSVDAPSCMCHHANVLPVLSVFVQNATAVRPEVQVHVAELMVPATARPMWRASAVINARRDLSI